MNIYTVYHKTKLQNYCQCNRQVLILYTGLFNMIVGVLTTCHTQYTWDSSICIFLFNRTTLQVFVTYLVGALYVHHLWFYKHQPMMIRCYSPGHLVLQMQPNVISFYGVTSRIRFMFLLSQVSRNWRLLHASNSVERTRLSCWCL